MSDILDTILIVDDDKTHCAVLAGALRRRGHVVYVAHNYQDALAELAAWRPDCAVLDLRLGSDSGLKLLDVLTTEHPDVTCVVLTGYGSIATAVDAIKKGAVQYLTKPVGVDELLRAFQGQAEAEADIAGDVAPLDLVEWEHLQRVLLECEGNVSEAARRLHMHRRTLQRKLARGRAR
jgi:two-component system, response regulator RegA